MHAEAVLPALRAAYIKGRLTPFVGSGMSSNLSSFDKMVCLLAAEAETALPAAVGGSVTNDELAVRADQASTRLRATGRLEVAIQKALGDGPVESPEQTVKLAQLPWPLVLTTNYDDLYVSEASLQIRRMHRGSDPERPCVLGRSAPDCRRVLRALRAPDHPIVWALQGFVGGQSEHGNAYDHSNSLGDQIVVGHAEYRRTTNAEPYFRRSFSEVFRSRSFLFLGSSIERYLLDLFSEIIELFGPNPYPHFAVFTDGDESKQDFRESLAHTHGIQAIILDEHGKLPSFLDELHAAIYPDHKAAIASIRPVTHPALSVWQTAPDTPRLGISRTRLLDGSGTWRVFSIGGYPDDPEIGEEDKDALGWRDNMIKNNGWEEYHVGFKSDIRLWRDGREPRHIGVYARMAPNDPSADRIRPTWPIRTDPDPPHARDLRLIPCATVTVMRQAARLGISDVDAELFAGSSWRAHPAAYAFLQMIRGWTEWQQYFEKNGKYPPPRLTIHLTPTEDGDRDVIRELDAGRLDLESLLVRSTDHVLGRHAQFGE